MRRALLAIAALAFFAAWFAGGRLPIFLTVLVNAVVLIYLEFVTLRRLVLSVAAVFDHELRTPELGRHWPRLTVLVPCHNEAPVLMDSLAAWEAVDYPRARLLLVLIDDDSEDETPKLLEGFAREQPWVLVVRKPEPAIGKGAALNFGLAAAAPSDAVVVFDADARPAPDCLQRLAAHLENPAVAAVAGRMLPDDDPGPAAIYSRLESSVHQRLTLTGASILGATVPLLGSAYLIRRQLIDSLKFRADHRLEDIDLTMRLLVRNFRIVFEPRAHCAHRPPGSAKALFAQRTAWSRGFHQVAFEHLRDIVTQADSGLAAIDRTIYACGYFDRFMLVLGLLLAALDATVCPSLWMPWWAIAAYLAVGLAQIPLAILLDRWSFGQMLRLAPALALTGLDLLTELAAVGADMLGRPRRWKKTARIGEETQDD